MVYVSCTRGRKEIESLLDGLVGMAVELFAESEKETDEKVAMKKVMRGGMLAQAADELLSRCVNHYGEAPKDVRGKIDIAMMEFQRHLYWNMERHGAN